MKIKTNLLDSDILLENTGINDKIKFSELPFSLISKKIFVVNEVTNYKFGNTKIKILNIVNNSTKNLFLTIDFNGDNLCISREITENQADHILNYKTIKNKEKEFFKSKKTNSEIDEWISDSYDMESQIRKGINEKEKKEFDLLCLNGSNDKNIDIEIYENFTRIFLVIFCNLSDIEYAELRSKS